MQNYAASALERGPADAVAYYSENAVAFHASYRFDANRRERLRVWRRLLDWYAKGAHAAYDLGCGSGILACELARRGIATIGIDGAAGMLALARQTAQQAGLHNVSFQMHRLPLADPSGHAPADLVISSSALEYLDSLHQALACARALLRPGGTLLFSVSNRCCWSRKAVRLVHRFTGRPPYIGLIRHFMTVPELRAALAAAGLEYLEHEYFGRADRINRALRRVLPARHASNMILVVARRPA